MHVNLAHVEDAEDLVAISRRMEERNSSEISRRD
jgi:hypothetical protein